ncbi:hypothetical protein B0T26DRAFT_656572, partial [Lasiosphaeria miniovina]
INGALPLFHPNNVNRASDYTCIVFVFVYSLGYSIGFGPAAWVYGSEVRAARVQLTIGTPTNQAIHIFPTAVRARGLSFAASAGAIGSIMVAQIWPVGIANIGSKIYFFFMAINLICVPIIYLLYPETNGRRLEDMDVLFGGNPAVIPTHLLEQDVDDTRGLVPKTSLANRPDLEPDQTI